MRIPTFFTDRAYAAAPRGAVQAPPRGEAGSDGDKVLEELLAGGPDVNPELSGARKHAVYDEMRKTDPTVKSVLLFLGLPVRAAKWGLNPRDDTPEALLVRDMVAWNLGLEGSDGELDLSWDELTQQALTMLAFGPCLEEMVWGDVRAWRDADGDPHLVRPLDRLALRMPSSIMRVRMDGGVPVRVEQNLPGTSPIVNTNRDKLAYMVFEREGARWDGVSLLRPAWAAWRLKKHLLILTGISWDRWATNLPAIWHPDTPQGAEEAKAIGRNLRSHERGYVHFPSAGLGPNGRPESEWYIELLETARAMADPTPVLRWLCEQEAEAGLQQALRQGLGHSGARATAEVQIDPFYLAVEAIANQIRRARARQVIRKLVEVNFGVEAADRLAPVLTVSKIQMRSLDTVSRAVALLAQDAGVDFTDKQTVDDLRELCGLPASPEEASTALPRDRVLTMLRGAGLDAATVATVAARLPQPAAPPPAEGNGLAA